MGVLVDQGYVNERLVFEQQGAFIAGVWDRCKSLIYARRIDRKSPQYMENFELLRKRFDLWGKKNRPRVWATDERQTTGYYSHEATVSTSTSVKSVNTPQDK
jgi:hypothetical protein